MRDTNPHKDVTYSDFIITIENTRLHKPFETRLDCIQWCITVCGVIDQTIFDHIQRAYDDGFFKA